MTATDLSLLIRSIDAHPDDRTLLLAIADASDEVEWGSGAGWKALVKGGCVPMGWRLRMGWVTGRPNFWKDTEVAKAWVPQRWFVRLPTGFPPRSDHHVTGQYVWAICGLTRSAAYLSAALAFNRCSIEEQQVILEVLG